MKIVFFEINALESKILLALYGDIDYDTAQEPLNAANAGRYAEAVVISSFIYSDLSRDVLAKLPNLRLITTRSRTLDHIDLDYCREKGIVVTHVPAYGVHSVAEHVFSLLLSLTRHIPEAVRHVREGNFSLQGLEGVDLHGKTLGVIGAGAIGQQVIGIARGFGMNVLACDVHPQIDFARRLGFTYTDLDNLLARADIISLHVPVTPASHHLLSDREFALMKDGVIVINTAFGTAVDIKALVLALDRGKVSAAGFDVLPDEPALREEAELLRDPSARQHSVESLLGFHALLHHKNVIVTPHSAFYTKETVTEILRTTGDNIQSFLAGDLLSIAVNAADSEVTAKQARI